MQTHHPLALAPKVPLVLAAIASLALFLPSSHAAVIVSDDFNSGYTNGDSINGRVTPVGGLTWASSGVPSLLYNGGVTTSSNQNGYGIFVVPFSVGSYTSFEIDANVKPQFNNLNLSFTTTATAGQVTQQMTIMGAINGLNGWGLFNGNVSIAGGSGIDASTYHDAVLKYDVLTSTLTFSYGATQLYSGVVDLGTGSPGGVGAIQYAGFSYNTITTNTTEPEFNSFAVVAVPEPSTIALGALGLGVVFFRLRRKQRTV